MKVTPRHDKFINALADSKIHLIATMRGKDQYEMEKDGNKTTVKKLGVGAKQRDGFEYEFTCTFLIDQKTNMSETQKDNTHLFEHEGAVLLSENHGRKLIQWANSGEGYTPVVRNIAETKPEEAVATDGIKDVKNQVVTIAKEKSAISDEVKNKVKDLLVKYHPSGNPNKLDDIDQLNALYEELKNI